MEKGVSKVKVSIETMVEEIRRKLQFVNGQAIKADSFSEEHYDDLSEIYEMIAAKESFSVSEIEAIVKELAKFVNNDLINQRNRHQKPVVSEAIARILTSFASTSYK